jgi:hypothetical protein
MTELRYLIEIVQKFLNVDLAGSATIPSKGAHLILCLRHMPQHESRRLWAGCCSPEVKRSAASHDGEQHPGRRPSVARWGGLLQA